jgi:hypothetical protein
LRPTKNDLRAELSGLWVLLELRHTTGLVQGFEGIHRTTRRLYDAFSIDLNQITVTLDPAVDAGVEQIRFVRAMN